MILSAEEIYVKWYADKIRYKAFLKIIKLDPTTVFKKDKVKMGRYCKWLLMQYFKSNFQTFFYNDQIELKAKVDPASKNFLFDDKFSKEIYDSLEVFHNWFKFKNKHADRDIYKYELYEFTRRMTGGHYNDYQDHLKYKKDNGKVFLIYDDENLTVLEPLNFAACYKYSKNTQWCSKTLSSYEGWSRDNILLRFIDKKNKMIFRLTYSYNSDRWSWATPVYPEFSEQSLIKERPFRFKKITPFSFKYFKKEYDKSKYEADDTAKAQTERFNQLKRLFNLIDKKCAAKILERYTFRQEEYFAAKKKKEEEVRKLKTETVPHFSYFS